MPYQLPSLEELTETTLKHWAKYCPDLTLEYKKQGRLEEAAREAAQMTLDACQRMIKQGAEPWEAWEAMRAEWCLLPQEEKARQSQQEPEDETHKAYREVLNLLSET